MSSSSPGRYKSRLFNFFNRQAIRVNSEIGKTVRNLRVATEFGIQALLYPLYLMVQAGRSMRNQLEQKAQPLPLLLTDESDSLSPSSADESIEQILTAVQPLLAAKDRQQLLNKQPKEHTRQNWIAGLTIGDRNKYNSQISRIQPTWQQTFLATITHLKAKIIPPAKAIRGIASVLESQDLVLVDRNNQIVDILDSQQQEQIKQFIFYKFGLESSVKSRFFSLNTHKILSFLPNLSQENPKLLLPFRSFWKVINWIQQSPIAVNTNLFGESQLVVANSEKASSPVTDKLLLKELLKPVDNAVADLENRSRAIRTPFLKIFGSNLLQKINFNPGHKSLTISQASQNIKENYNDYQPDPFQIQVLIKAAIEYFFKGNQKRDKIANQFNHVKSLKDQGNNSLNQSNHLLTDSYSEDEVEDPWLSWDDIFTSLTSKTNSQKEKNNSSQTNQILISSNNSNAEKLPATSPLPDQINSQAQIPFLKISHSTQLQTVKEEKNQKEQLSTSKKSRSNLKQTSPSEASITTNSTNQNSVEIITNLSASESEQLEAAPEWLEADATTLGYVKHPLEILLEWLDRIMLLIEEFWLKIWQQIQQLTRNEYFKEIRHTKIMDWVKQVGKLILNRKT